MHRRRGPICAAVCLTVVVLTAVAWPARAADDVAPGYVDYAALRLQLESIAQSPDAALQSLGRTREGREIYLLKIGRAPLDEKPAVLLVGNVDPARLVDGEVAARVARRLVDRASSDKRIGELLDRFTFYVVPRPSPDAAEAFFQHPRRERTANSRPVDDDNDGRTDEDGPDDLDGDGRITTMRVEDASGPYMPHPDDSRVLIKADPTRAECGRYRLYSEGRDDDGDGRINEDGPGGVAFNRNFTFDYDYFGAEAGPHQVSEPESRAVADFAFAHPNIAMVVALAPDENLLDAWKPAAGKPKRDRKEAAPSESSPRIQTHVLPDDAGYYKQLARGYREIFGPGDGHDVPVIAGSFSRWAYFHYGRWSLAARGWQIPRSGEQAAKQSKKDNRGADELAAIRWFADRKIDGFVAWKPYAHPDFPGRKVEIGGFVPFVRDNPPPEEIDQLADKHFEFVCGAVERLPRLALGSTEVEPLGGGVHRVTVEVINRGYLPTVSQMGRTSGEPHPLQIELALPEGVSPVGGSARSRLPRILGSGGKVEKQILLRSTVTEPVNVRVRVWSPSAGKVTGRFTLPAASPLPPGEG